MKYGLGWTASVDGWFKKIYKKFVTDLETGSNPAAQIGGIIIVILSFIVALIAWIITAIVDTIVAFFIWLVGVFNDDDDDIARDRIMRMSCGQINNLDDSELNEMTRSLLENFTGDDDENALIKIVECLECTRLRNNYWPLFGAQILDDTHGSEYDRLRAAMHRCLDVNFADWDDDASRVFIENSSCPDLRLLLMEDIKTLLRNLFGGTTGSAEEWAIIKLIDCLEDVVVQALVLEPGFSVGDFDDEVDRNRWDRLKIVFGEKGVAI